MHVDEMFVESMRTPLGIDVRQPAFSWSFGAAQQRAQLQTAYRILVADGEDKLRQGQGLLWDSGKCSSRNNAHVPYQGPPLQSRLRYYWQVQVWDRQGQMTESAVSWWEMGLLDEKDWGARWIAAYESEPDGKPALPLFRREFHLDKPVSSARVYICGLGQYELRLNARKVGDRVLEPGWTNYDKTCLYCVYDVTEELSEGGNAIGVMLGNGFFNVTGGRYSKFKRSFGTPRCLVQLEITHTDGTLTQIVSDSGWSAAPGPITFSCIYGGEDYDARRTPKGWDRYEGAAGDAWRPAREVNAPAGQLKAQAFPPLQVKETLRPVQISEPAPGVFVADFGQNFSGWVQIRVKGPEGAPIAMSPAELLKESGTVNQKWTGSPTKFTYVLNGNREDEVWSPRFSYTGFRYLQIEGAVPADKAVDGQDVPVLLAIEGQMIYPDMPIHGHFACSHPLLNRTHEIINRAMLSNMKSIFTDCPHREKLGWLEQVHLMGPSLAYNYDVERLLVKTMEDIRDAQLPNGMVPTTAPEYVVFSEQWRCFRDSVSWGAAYILTGWNLLHLYGNRRVLIEHYETMKAYIEYVKSNSDELIVREGLGDWYDAGSNPPGFVQNTPVAHTETAMFYHIADVFAQIAALLHQDDDAAAYAKLREKIKRAFNAAFWDCEKEQYASGSQSSNAMPLVLGLTDPSSREKVLSHIIEDIERHGYHTTAGDVGHRFVLLALAEYGRSDIVYAMSRQTDHPSYGYQIVHGATTLTEAWDGPTVGKSQNHFMLGHVEEWFYRDLAGIRYRIDPVDESCKLVVKPAIVNGLDEASADCRLPAGQAKVAWKRHEHGRLTLDITVPVNCTAEIYVPSESLDTVLESGRPIKEVASVQVLRTENRHYIVIEAGSGSYRFESRQCRA
ncbi:family 78 glycoside hydrolase catalytic domain [Bacillus sp. 3255]|uniref:alpha-L-rhamnosidase n=1 Tax=Bacillus sp. 3255 TaxID=2817904 RepID=UPI002856BFDC|nr:family 78 glycoside hydrolase catalytic domain [Bacillus sp. 3255]MDR6880584.1 hypothetical protein [Bacillus sp. 3255]